MTKTRLILTLFLTVLIQRPSKGLLRFVRAIYKYASLGIERHLFFLVFDVQAATSVVDGMLSIPQTCVVIFYCWVLWLCLKICKTVVCECDKQLTRRF